MDDEVDIGATSLFPVDQVSRVQVGDTSCALVRSANGDVSVFVDNCPHLHMPIADGRVEDNFIVCPWHGAYFDRATGESHSPLAVEPLQKIPARVLNGRILCTRSG